MSVDRDDHLRALALQEAASLIKSADYSIKGGDEVVKVAEKLYSFLTAGDRTSVVVEINTAAERIKETLDRYRCGGIVG